MRVNHGDAPDRWSALLRTSHVFSEKEGSYIGTPTSMACCSAACRATRAPLWVSVGNAAVAEAVGAMLKYELRIKPEGGGNKSEEPQVVREIKAVRKTAAVSCPPAL